MPWNEVSAMRQRLELVQLAQAARAGSTLNLSELCRRFAVSRQTAYKWIARHEAGGPAALADRSRRPHTCPHRTAADMEKMALELRAKHPTWGGRKIRARLVRLAQQGPGKDASLKAPDAQAMPAVSTFTGIFRRHDLIDPRESQKRKSWVRFEREQPNELWQMDFKGHFATDAGRCHPLTVLDDHSRFNLVLQACANERTQTVQEHLSQAFERYGMPLCILCDNGAPFGGESDHGLTPLCVWLMRLGIAVTHGRPYHPQTQGKEERFHRTFKADVIAGRAFADLIQAQSRFDPFRQEYNHERPHEALAMQTPAQRWQPSRRAFPAALPAIEYGPGDQVRKVQDKGVIFFKGRAWPVANCLRGQPVAVRATQADGLYEVRFCAHKVTELDLRSEHGKR